MCLYIGVCVCVAIYIYSYVCVYMYVCTYILGLFQSYVRKYTYSLKVCLMFTDLIYIFCAEI